MNKKVNVCAIKPKAGYSFDVFIEDLNEDLKPDDGVLDAVQNYFEYYMKMVIKIIILLIGTTYHVTLND